MNRPPIALFVYNRIIHAKLTIEALQKNIGADESILYIFSDGLRVGEDSAGIESVRNFIRDIKGFAEVIIVERERNLGLSCSIITGVTDVISKHGKVVVLEDDIITSPYFLTYMNDALHNYQDVNQVMHIAAYMLPITTRGLKDTFFFRNTNCWGWGTWKRSWDKLETDASFLKSQFTEDLKYGFNIDGTYDSWGILEKTSSGIINSWAILWYASVFLHGGVCLHPSKSLTKNIGHDGSGTHCDKNDMYDVTVSQGMITEFEEMPVENRLALRRIKKYILFSRIPTLKMILKRLYKIIFGCIK